ncbi:Uncharacterised protein (plasmid) [Legionella adelaidensis]|uniref:Uncharacterized protein n=1 Tax=Legionella adelaidensis TaxID=45056 RepID=A0A448N974_9GAMM|nr:Uncharacterised protein [Legionella adelaidensis]
MDTSLIRKRFNVVLLRTLIELNDIASFELEALNRNNP